MKLLLLSLLLALSGCVHVHGAPVDPAAGAVEEASCTDASVLGAAELALAKINEDRQEGYVFSLHRLSNAHMKNHGENSVVFYLTLDVVETNCSVLSRKNSKDSSCQARPDTNTPVYGQCKAAIFISKVHRVVRLYKYDCVVRPVPAPKVTETCPDCPTHISMDQQEIKDTVTLSMDKFNKDSGLAKRFAVLKVARAMAGMATRMYYNVEYTIQETTCPQSAAADAQCPLMDCEFAHKGFCEASHHRSPTGDSEVTVECQIYEPEAAEREKHTHDHVHDHTKGHGDAHGHAHDHTHLHEHEHHHHEHDHDHKTSPHKPQGAVRTLPAMDQPMTLPAFPDVPAGGPEVGVTLPLKEDPQIPGQMEPVIEAFPTAVSAQCVPEVAAPPSTLVQRLFTEDPMFKPAA